MPMLMGRRKFLAFVTAGGALVVTRAPANGQGAREAVADLEGFLGNIGPFIQINPDNSTIVGAGSPEIGTSMHTSLPMLVAEEIGLDWARVSVRQMPVGLYSDDAGRARWRYGAQGGGGSDTLASSWEPVRRLAAVTREILLRAAGEELGVAPERLRTHDSVIIDDVSGRSLEFADVAVRAATIEFPEINGETEIVLKDPADFTLIGSEVRLHGVRDVVTGKARYGSDAEMDGALHAVVARCPYFDGDVASVDDADARAFRGVRDIVILPKPTGADGYLAAGVAVLADTQWAAMRGRALLDIVWDKGSSAGESSQQTADHLRAALEQDGRSVVDDGDVDAALASASLTVEAIYELPMLAHATMEPQNATVRIGEDSIEVLSSGHSMSAIVGGLARASGLELQQIHYTPSRTGGSFGRRLSADMVLEAYAIARLADAPVRVVWTREDDMTMDIYRPMSAHRMRGAIDADGRLAAWSHHAALASNWSGDEPEPDAHLDVVWPDNFPRRVIDDVALSFSGVACTPNHGYWRAPMPTQHGFVCEGFMNELANAAGVDPLAFRLSLLDPAREIPYDEYGGPTYDTGRLSGCLRAAAEMAGWDTPPPDGVGRGIAGYFTFGSYCAAVIEATVDDDGRVRVPRVFVAGDAGRIVNPNGFRAQLEGAVMDGLSTALRLKIDIEDGRTVQRNFDTYQIMRIADAPPVIETRLIQGADHIHGAGEIGMPVVAPALCEAIFQATGTRIRSLPIGDQLRA